uniref:40S ribosomal protein S26 n=1 Tax=Trepomonas sp. PC1 TaxID=1076344 RepID=A0A146KHE0_9EUKA|eukprot:JAP96092.1 Ribosomal protein S26 [Trepomonas sp. PC1]
MPVKRGNHGRCKNHAGRTVPVHCQNCYRLVPVDKITRRFQIKQMIDSNIQQDVLAACIIKDVTLPKQYTKIQYCVSCAIHNHLVHVRSAEERKPKPVSLDRFKRVAAKKVEKKPVEKKVEEVKQ